MAASLASQELMWSRIMFKKVGFAQQAPSILSTEYINTRIIVLTTTLFIILVLSISLYIEDL